MKTQEVRKNNKLGKSQDYVSPNILTLEDGIKKYIEWAEKKS